MRKIALLLAALTVLGLLAGCKKEETDTPAYTIPDSNVNIQLDGGWEAVEDSNHGAEMIKDGVTMTIDTYVSTDFVDMQPLEELFDDCNYIFFRNLSEKQEVEAPQTYTVEDKTIISAMYTAKSEDGVAHYYCFGVGFDDRAQTKVWVCFSGAEKAIKNNRADLKTTVESIVSDGTFQSQEEIDAILNGEYYEEDPVSEQENLPLEQDPQ